jgi:putative ABC transport system permease protein
MTGFLQDMRYGVRVLLRAPGATIVAVLALALGIGVNSTQFTSVNALVLHPLPFPHLERIMSVWETVAKSNTQRYDLAPANFVDWNRQSRSFEATAAYEDWSANLTGTSEPARVQAALVSPSFFTVLGMHPALGRTFTDDEGKSEHARAVVVSNGFWRQHLASSPHAVGRHIELNGEAYTIAGVMPPDFDWPLTNDIWAPLQISIAEQAQRAEHTLTVLALLKPNVSVEQARKEAEQIARRLQQQYPHTNEARSIEVLPLRSLINEVTERFVLILLAAAVFTLLLACANVGNLQLARAASREKEIAVRAALGANRYQIARQLFAESILLAAAAALVGLLLASWDIAFVKTTIPPAAFAFAAGLRSMHIDRYVVLYTVGMSVVAAVLCSLPAALQLLYQRSRTDLNDALKRGGRTSSASPGRNRLQSMLIVYEVCMALVLLIGAGFMVKMFNGVLAGYYGYDPKNVLELQVSLPTMKYKLEAQVVNFYDRLLPELQSLPGTRAAAVLSYGPAVSLFVQGRPDPRPGEPEPDVQSVSEGYLSSMRIPLLKGRFVSDRDRPDSAPVAVISESVARQYWPGSDPIGQRIKIANSASPWLTVVGISGNVVQDAFEGRPSLLIYLPYTQRPYHSARFVIRTYGDPTRSGSAARAAVRKVDKDLPVYGLKSMEREIFENTSGIRAAAQAMSTYAGVALLLAATGIFAVISFFVAQRTHDIGVRMALGASSGDVLKLTLSGATRLTMGGLLIGGVIGFGLMKFMSSLLFNVVKLDLLTFVACAAVLGLAALAASYLPARRATKIDPLVALRQE